MIGTRFSGLATGNDHEPPRVERNNYDTLIGPGDAAEPKA